jgi:hypothetical protein
MFDLDPLLRNQKVKILVKKWICIIVIKSSHVIYRWKERKKLRRLVYQNHKNQMAVQKL